MSGVWPVQIELRRAPGGRLRRRLWREWCFTRAVLHQFRWRLLLVVVVLLSGALLFRWLEPEKQHTFARATFYVWSLVFGNPPEDFPAHPVLQVVFFVVPVLGLILILESIVDFALILRDRRRNERSWCVMMAKSMSGHIILVGLGRLGYRTYRMLAQLGEQVVVLERDANNSFLEEVRRAGAPIILGDARREELLQDANVKAARSIVLATSDDLANLEAALDARKHNPQIRVVLRMFDPTLAEKIRDGFQIQIAMSQSALSAPAFATAAVDATIVNSTIVNNQLVITQQWEVRPGGPLEGKSVGELMEWSNLCILERKPRDAGATLFPPPSVRLFAGDQLLVQGAFDALRKLRAEHFNAGGRSPAAV